MKLLKEDNGNRPNKVNIHYEYDLFDITISQKLIRKFNQAWEFVYFFCSDSTTPIIPWNSYSQDYINYLNNELDLPRPQFAAPNSLFNNWWGALDNIKLERKINSKLFSGKIEKQLNLNQFPTYILNNITLLKNFKTKLADYNQWLIQHPYHMAGRGKRIFDPKNSFELDSVLNEKSFNNQSVPLILLPFHQRIVDIGVSYKVKTNEKKFYFLKNTNSGQFEGGVIFNQIDDLFGSLSEIIQKDTSQIKKDFLIYDTILNELADLKLTDHLNIDSYYYKNSDQILFRPLVEFNYRKTMGHFLTHLKRFLPNNGVGEWVILKKQVKYTNFPQIYKALRPLLYSKTSKTGIIILAPSINSTLHLFLSAQDLKHINLLKNKLKIL